MQPRSTPLRSTQYLGGGYSIQFVFILQCQTVHQSVIEKDSVTMSAVFIQVVYVIEWVFTFILRCTGTGTVSTRTCYETHIYNALSKSPTHNTFV